MSRRRKVPTAVMDPPLTSCVERVERRLVPAEPTPPHTPIMDAWQRAADGNATATKKRPPRLPPRRGSTVEVLLLTKWVVATVVATREEQVHVRLPLAGDGPDDDELLTSLWREPQAAVATERPLATQNLSDYELQRLKNIERNNAELRALGIDVAKAECGVKPSPKAVQSKA